MEMNKMSNILGINCKKVYDSGKEYIDYHNEIISIRKELEEVSNNISTIWQGADSNNFVSSFNDHIKELNLIINFLGSNGTLLKKTANEHSSIEENFAVDIERSDIEDEPKYEDRH